MTTNPLSRTFQTTEGILVIVTDAVVGATAAIDPHLLGPKWAAIVIGVQHVALLAQRGLVKVAALQATGVDPIVWIEHELLGEAEAAPVVEPAPAPTPHA